MAGSLRLSGLTKRFGDEVAVDGIDLEIGAGEFFSLLGSSGCGKTTTLRMIAGFEKPDAGSIHLDGRDLSQVPPHKRPVNTVFQSYALFPFLSVFDNVAFGLRYSEAGKDEQRRRVDAALGLVQMGAMAKRRPHQLSGGQQQRVALARALAIEPAVLLLDEPLSALDAKVRVQLRDEIRRVQLDVGTTTLFVTHDQEEALAVADRVGVMNAGRLDQIAPPTELYARPATRFVAEFVGLSNRMPADVSDGHATLLGNRVALLDGSVGHGRGQALVRPESVQVTDARDGGVEANARVVSVAFLGPFSRVQCRLDDGLLVVAQVPSSTVSRLAQHAAVRVDVEADAVLVVPD